MSNPAAAAVLPAALPRAGASAYLVAWQDSQTGVITDAGIYSEASPTCARPINGRHLRPVALLYSQSRFEAGQGGFERAVNTVADLVERTPSLAWVKGARTYRLMERNRKQMYAERARRGVVAHPVRTPRRV
jgi:hypothetical protein